MSYEPTELAAKMVEYMDCHCEVFAPAEDDDLIIKTYRSELQRGRAEGFTPVLVSVDETLWECLVMNADEENEPDFEMENVRGYRNKVLREYGLTPGDEFLRSELSCRREECDVDDVDWDEEMMGEMSDGACIDELSSIWPYDSEKTNEVILARIPTANPWEVFAWLPMGNWNDCPDTLEMMAVCKRWYELYGAVPAALDHDQLEFIVKPVSEDVAMELALEHYAFCPDRVEQCEEDGSVGKLADSLTKSTVWYFWWD